MPELQIKKESFPERCEVCHQKDNFDAKNNYCSRCNSIIENKQQRNLSREVKVHIGGVICGIVGSVGWFFLPSVERLQSFDLFLVKMLGSFFFTVMGMRLGTKMGPDIKNYIREKGITENTHLIDFVFIMFMSLISGIIIGIINVILMLGKIDSILVGLFIGTLIGIFLNLYRWFSSILEE